MNRKTKNIKLITIKANFTKRNINLNFLNF